MSKKSEQTPLLIEIEEETIESGKSVLKMGRTAVLATLGLAAFGSDRIAGMRSRSAEYFDKLVERGETAEKETRQALAARRKQAKKMSAKAENNLDKRLDEVVEKLNLPTTTDVKKLATKINNLNKKIDELAKAQAA